MDSDAASSEQLPPGQSSPPNSRRKSKLRGLISSHRLSFPFWSERRGSDLTPQNDKGPLGLTTFHQPAQETAGTDTIFVHGLGGDSVKTWRISSNPESCWPTSWLPLEPGFERVRIHSFGFDADWRKRSRVALNIHRFAQSLLRELRNYPDIRQCNNPIMIVAHSMGGCIAMKMYILAKQDPACVDLASRIRCIFFLATPHRGSDLAGILRRILRVSGAPKPYINDLDSKSAALLELNDMLRHHAEDLRLWSFFETQPMSSFFEVPVVDKTSATLGYRNEEVSPMDANHRTVCKFHDREDNNYRKVRNALANALEFLQAEEGEHTVLITTYDIFMMTIHRADLYPSAKNTDAGGLSRGQRFLRG
ncbi:hypothetical protein FDECE_11881 [Fusarium decemcellulare]|nr:hypothetical protein FDECE_11881 [Fusarium decemcellulare]